MSKADEIDKEKAYNTVALKYYELQELNKIKNNLLDMKQEEKAEVKIKTIHWDFSGAIFGVEPIYKTRKETFEIVPQLLVQIIDKLIEDKQNYLDKAIDLTIIAERGVLDE